VVGFGTILGKLWENFGKTLGKLLLIIKHLIVISGKVLGKLWEKFGKTLEEIKKY
jgi:hypothetical protein